VLTEANLVEYILLCWWIKNKSLLSIKHNYYSLFWHKKSHKKVDCFNTYGTSTWIHF